MKRSIFALKSLGDGQVKSHCASHRTLGAFSLTLLGVGCIMGTGIFVLTGQVAAAHAGPAVVLSFLLAALTAALGAMCYAEMAAMLPIAGSGYVYAYATMGELPAFLMGWVLALEYLVGAATVSSGWSGYLCALLGHLGLVEISEPLRHAPLAWDATQNSFVYTGGICNVPAMCIIFAVCSALSRGTRDSARLNACIVFVKIAVVLLFIAFALPHIKSAYWQPFIPTNTGTFGAFGWSGIFQGATLLFFAYLGFDAVSVAAGETRNPQRDVPIGILASLSICAVLYVITGAVLTGLVPYSQLGVSYPMALGVKAIGMSWFETVVEIGALAGLTSVLLVQLFAQPRILLAMAEDGFLPPSMAHVHPKHGTPNRLTWMTGSMCMLCAGFLPIDMLAELTSIGTLLAFAIVGLGVIILRYKRPEWPRKFRAPGGAWPIPGLCLVTSAALMYTASLTSFAYLMAWMVVGTGIYFLYGRTQVGRTSAERSRLAMPHSR